MNEQIIIESFKEEPEAWVRPIPIHNMEPKYDLINIDARWGIRLEQREGYVSDRVVAFLVVSTVHGDKEFSVAEMVKLFVKRMNTIETQERMAKFDNYFEKQKELRDA